MQELAIPAEQRPTRRKPTDKGNKQRVSKKILQAIELLATGECKTQRAAAERVNITHEWLCKQLAKDNIRTILKQRMSATILTAGPRAAARMVELIDAESEKVSREAAAFILGVEGVAPSKDTSITINNNSISGYIIEIVRPDEAPTPIDITP
jgi:hypothetical protein